MAITICGAGRAGMRVLGSMIGTGSDAIKIEAQVFRFGAFCSRQRCSEKSGGVFPRRRNR
jgi:hypothetical protein